MKAVNFIRPDIASMEAYAPIFPFEVLAERLGRAPEDLVKIDANENPYGPPDSVRDALRSLQYTHIYPDPESRHLRAGLAEFTEVPAEHLLVGAGADELIDLSMRLFLEPGDSIINCPPTFGMYSFDAAINQARVISVRRRSDFSLDLDEIERRVRESKPKLVFLSSPNNPDGSLLPNDTLERLLALPVTTVLDEAYIEFADGLPTRFRDVPKRDNLIVLRTFSKWAGLAGLRVGYAAFPADLMPHLWKIKQPYNVSVAASTAAIAAAKDQAYLKMHVARMRAERVRMIALLRETPYLRPYPSQANFVLCQVVGRDARELKLALEGAGILIRYFNKPGLQDHVRFSVGRPDQTDKLMTALKRLP